MASLPEALRTEGEGIGEVAMGLAAVVAAPVAVAGVLVAVAGLIAIWLAVALVAIVAIATTSHATQRETA